MLERDCGEHGVHDERACCLALADEAAQDFPVPLARIEDAGDRLGEPRRNPTSASEVDSGRSNTRGWVAQEGPQGKPNGPGQASKAPSRAKPGFSRAAPPSDDRRRAAGSHRQGSPVQRTFYLLDKVSNVVQGKPRFEIPKVRVVTWRPPLPCAASACQAATQRDDLAEGTAGAARFRFQLGGHVVIQSEVVRIS